MSSIVSQPTVAMSITAAPGIPARPSSNPAPSASGGGDGGGDSARSQNVG